MATTQTSKENAMQVASAESGSPGVRRSTVRPDRVERRARGRQNARH
jgi:hypothetical protein